MKYYELLDVALDASAEQIKTAYRILVQLHHPDRLQHMSAGVREYAEDRLKRINEAYAVLSDPAKRARYDDLYRRHARAADVWEDEDDAASRPARARRPESERAAARRAYEEWKQQEAEKVAELRAHARAHRAEQERREAEERIRRAAEEQFPRARAQGDDLLLHFAPGQWTRLIRIPAGEFLMGSDPARDAQASRAEQPQHRVHLADYFISQFPITIAQFRIYLAATARTTSAAPGHDHCPMVHVAWDETHSFCQWLSQATGQLFHLPTEAQWEKAARGGDGRLYPWGDEWDDSRLGAGEAAPGVVGRRSPAADSPYGVADLTGSVWQWCADWYDEKEYARRGNPVTRDPPGPAQGAGYVVRGGAFDSPAKHARCAQRNWFYPHHARPNLGFRIVIAPK